MITALKEQTEKLGSLIRMYPRAVKDYEFVKHKTRQALNQAKREGSIKITEEAIRSESVIASINEFETLENLKAEIEEAKLNLETMKAVLNYKGD